MKKLIIFVLTFTLFSCVKEEKPEYTIVSGTMTNTEGGTFKIHGNSFEKEISVNEDGTFIDTLYLDYNGVYEIRRQPLYLEKGKNISFEANAEDMTAIIFSRDLAVENNYSIQKSKLSSDILGNSRSLYALEESEFLGKLEELNQKRNELLENTTFTTEEFKEKEIKSLEYHKEHLLRMYLDYHPYLTGKEDFQISNNFPELNQAIDFDNAEEFNFSTAYRNLVLANLQKKISDEAEKNEDKDYYEVALESIKTVKSQNIKNNLAETYSYSLVSLANPVLEESYDQLLAMSSDENFKKELVEKYNKLKTLVKGKPSPKFNYENHKGGTTSLDDLKGKFIYIDVWATWCGPCKREIPFLKEVEKQYHDKNIEIVSISIDDKKDYETWREFVVQEELGGMQLYADNAWQSQFVTDYAIEGIPRFILIDTEGNIISADAPRPSDEKLIELFTEIGL